MVDVTPFPQRPATEEEQARIDAARRAHIVSLSGDLYEWAGAELQRGDIPPWEWYRLMFLRDAIARVRGPAPDETEVNLP